MGAFVAMHKRRRYISYLLRLWETEREGSTIWQASLQNPDTGKRTGFASLDALFAFLRRQTGADSHSGESEDGDNSE